MSNTIASLDLTDRQHEAYSFLCDFYFREGVAPSQREMSHAMGMKGRNSIRTHLDALIRKGWVRPRFCRNALTVYLPAVPFARVRGTDRDVILLGTVGGPVAFTIGAWASWLKKHLTAVEEFVAMADVPQTRPMLRLVRTEPDDHAERSA